MHLKANTASLKYNWSLTGNQFNDLSIGVTCSYLRLLATMRAAKFCTNCNVVVGSVGCGETENCARGFQVVKG